MLTKSQLYQINDFIQWYENNSLHLAPKYQRGAVWTEMAKSYFIDSIMKDYPVPPIFLRQTIDVTIMLTQREVIDGQQRLRAILDFYKNKFAWKKNHSGRSKSIYFDDLSDDEKIHFLNYTLFVNIISQEEDAVIFDMFSRLNSNSIVVNDQEKRNAKYWGYFKLFIIDLGNELRPHFIKWNIFKDSALMRMADLDFLNSVAFVCINGLESESPTRVNKLYEKYDKSFDFADECYERILKTFKTIFSIFENMGKEESYLFTKSYLLTLFISVYNTLYHIEGLEAGKINCILSDSVVDFYSISDKLIALDNLLEIINHKNTINDDKYIWVNEFERLHRIRTTAKAERTQRTNLLIRYLNDG